jgi:hypothetical protein
MTPTGFSPFPKPSSADDFSRLRSRSGGYGGERFDPRRTGLDHLAFAAADRAELEEWQAHFERLCIDHTPRQPELR